MTAHDDLLLIRTDANARIGTGHLMRCLALAQAWRAEGGAVTFVTACDSEGLLRRLRDEGTGVFRLDSTYPEPGEWETTSRALAAHPGAWVVLDGYHFDPAYQRRIRETGHPLLVIDDLAHLDCYVADLILNQNIYAEDLHYDHEPGTRLLLGTAYALLRREFWPWQTWQRETPEVARKVLVTLGGSDPDNQTLKVIRALQGVDVPGLEATVVVGASNPHVADLEAAAGDSQSIRLVRNVINMPELMSWADVAISAGGSTCWELMLMGVPSLLVTLAENQRRIAEALDRIGFAVSLGWYSELEVETLQAEMEKLMLDPSMRCQMSTIGPRWVDGAGAKRTCEVLRAEGKGT